MIPDGSCTLLLLLSGCCSLQDEFLRAWSLPPISPTSNSSLMVVSLLLDGIFLPETAVLDLLDRLRAGYFDLVVILPPQLTGSLQLDSLWGSSQSAAVPSDHPGSAQLDPAVSAAKAVLSQWELCAKNSATNLFLWTVEQPGAAQRSFSSTTEFQKLGRFHDARREDSAVHQLTSVDSWPIVFFLRTFLWLSPRLSASTLLPPVPSVRFRTHQIPLSRQGRNFVPLSSTLICQGNSLRPLGTGVQVHSASPAPRGLWRNLRGHARRFTTAGSQARSTATFSPTSPTRTTSRSTWAAWVQRCWTSWVFLRHLGTLLSRYSRLWFSPFSHAGSGCKRILSSKGFRRAKKLKKCCVTVWRTQRWSFSPRRDGTPGSEASHQRLSDGPSESNLELSGPNWTCGGMWWYGGDIEGHCDDDRYDDAKVFASAPRKMMKKDRKMKKLGFT